MCAYFIVIMSIILATCGIEREFGEFWTTSAFLAGAITSIIAGFVGMEVAVMANGRVAL